MPNPKRPDPTRTLTTLEAAQATLAQTALILERCGATDLSAEAERHVVRLQERLQHLRARAAYSAARQTSQAAVSPVSEPPRPTPTPTAPSTAKHSPLTRRQLEVLRLIAAGASNAEIAERLVITQGTAANHVGGILGRLGLRNRVEAAVWLARHDAESK